MNLYIYVYIYIYSVCTWKSLQIHSFFVRKGSTKGGFPYLCRCKSTGITYRLETTLVQLDSAWHLNKWSQDDFTTGCWHCCIPCEISTIYSKLARLTKVVGKQVSRNMIIQVMVYAHTILAVYTALFSFKPNLWWISSFHYFIHHKIRTSESQFCSSRKPSGN